MKHQFHVALALAAATIAMAGCARGTDRSEAARNATPGAQPAASHVTVYTGGNILTMAGDTPQYVEALAVKDGKIVAAGTRAEIDQSAGAGATVVDLGGKTMIPGFVDAHSHLLNYADSLVQANLNPPPIGKVNSIANLVAEIRALKVQLKANDTDWLIGQGYDQEFLAEKRHPTAADLDTAFPTNPVALLHASGHMLVANSAALKAAGITAATKDPAGGTIIRKKGSREPEGLVQETGMMPFMPFVKAPRPADVDLDLVRRAVAHYASYGVTTANEALLMPEKMPLVDQAAKAGLFTIDLIAMPAYVVADKLVGTGAVKWGDYSNGLKYGGLKMALDGSPQGKTAFLTEPYRTPVPGCTKDCRGFANMTQEDVNRLFVLCYRNNVQIFSHCNGDAAVDIMIKAHEAAEKELGQSVRNRRTVIIHSQIMRPDQMDAYGTYGLLPSLFTNHTYYWGDVHYANLGPERAAYLSPLKSALSRGIRATNHTDTTVTPIDQMFLLWTSVNRTSREGRVLGEAERVTPYEGLRALTANGAYEYSEEKTKGTLEVGKTADLVVLDRNPLKVDPMVIKDIKVVETIKAGKTVYSATQGGRQ